MDLGCTANDVSITGIAVAPGSPTKCVGGTTYTVDLDITVNFQNPARYDIGIFLSEDGNDPQTRVGSGGAASCSVGILQNSSPFKDLDSNGGVDTCGDGDKSISGVTRMSAVPVACQAAPLSNGNLFIPFVVTWNVNKTPPGEVCTSIADPFPTSNAKCNAPDSAVATEVQYGTVEAVVLPSISKSDGISTITAGDSTTYSVVITNSTGARLSDAIFQDLAVPNLTVNSLSCSASTGANCPGSLSIAVMQGGGILLPPMDPGSSVTFTIGATVNSATPAGTITNTASAIVRGEYNSVSDTNNVISKFGVNKTFTPASISPGGASVLSITLTNNNLSAATNVAFSDVYPLNLVNTGTPAVTNNCGGTVTAAPGGNSLALTGGSLAAGATCTVTANVTSAVGGAYTNSTGAISSDQYSGDAAVANLAIGVSSLQNATKTWQDLNGGEADPGDTIRYTITLYETAGVTATGVSVSDIIPATLSGPTVRSCPTGATCNIAGQTLTASNITIPANGSEVIVFEATIPLGTVAATAINNCASISNPTGIGAAPCASTITVSPSAVAITGNKWLYLDSGTTLSRTPPSGSPAAVTITSGASQTWSLSPPLAQSVTISPTVTPLAIIPVNLYLSSNVASSNRTARVTVACSDGSSSYSQTMIFDGTALNNPYLSTTPGLVLFNNLPFSADATCPAGQSWELKVDNLSGSGNILVSPVSGGNNSYFSLPSVSVINVDSVTSYSAAYPAVTTPASGDYSPGDKVYVRAVVSDPFGSYDITSATVAIKDPSGTDVVTGAAMNVIAAATTASTKTYEYEYTVPATATSGNWSVKVTANEGYEGMVSDDNTSSFTVSVLLPDIKLEKSVATNWDPYNGFSNPFAIPGGIVEYTLTITNEGPGSPDLDSVLITDAIPANTELVVTHPVITDTNVLASTGLTLSYVSPTNTGDDVYFSQDGSDFTYQPSADSNGADTSVTHLRINPQGVFSASDGVTHPSFQISFRVRVK